MSLQNSLNLTPGSAGQLLIGTAVTSAPTFGTITSSDTSITFTTGSGSLSIQTATATTGQRGGVLLASNADAIAGTDTAKAITADDLKAKLGPQTQYSVQLGNATTGAFLSSNVGTSGQVLVGGTTTPAFATLTSSDSTVSFTTGNNTLSLQAVGGGMTWTVQTGASQALVKSTGTFSNRAGSAVAFTLPVTAAVGDTFEVCNMGARAAGWTIAYNSGQSIIFGNVTTTTTTGSLAATAQGDAVRIVCAVANTTFVVTPGSIGNITYV